MLRHSQGVFESYSPLKSQGKMDLKLGGVSKLSNHHALDCQRRICPNTPWIHYRVFEPYLSLLKVNTSPFCSGQVGVYRCKEYQLSLPLPLVRYSGNKLVSLWLTASDKSFKQTNTIAAVPLTNGLRGDVHYDAFIFVDVAY